MRIPHDVILYALHYVDQYYYHDHQKGIQWYSSYIADWTLEQVALAQDPVYQDCITKATDCDASLASLVATANASASSAAGAANASAQAAYQDALAAATKNKTTPPSPPTIVTPTAILDPGPCCSLLPPTHNFPQIARSLKGNWE